MSETDYEENCEDASRFFPLETGGAFMGYWANDCEVVITACVPAGPNAVHARYSFEPDYGWQKIEIAKHYQKSGRFETYLGDWHTHPGGFSGRLSREDRRALRRVALSPTARAPNPISIIFYGDKEEWRVDSWCAAIRQRKLIWPWLDTWPAELQLYNRGR